MDDGRPNSAGNLRALHAILEVDPLTLSESAWE